ncbi:MAG: aldehyde dehydrogenase family protein [Solirubrobacteraceae bacterium]|nr:aldehyde dehydrogenase family protein [Solirubrobacteraceae bacterium]
MSATAIRGPLGGKSLGEVRPAGVEEVARAVGRARAALPAWRSTPLAERADLLEAAADLLWPEREELGRLLAAESGKPLAQAQFEVRVSIDFMRANARVGRRVGGEVLPTEGQHGTETDLAFTRREPLGVVAAILPFNFPVELFVEKCAAALVGGNVVVCKAPEEDPLVVARFHAALVQAGVPADALALVHGGREVGAALAGDERVDAISLTGSTGAGIAVAQAAAPRLRRLHLELGGNNAAIVLPDADLDLVERELVYGRLLMNGQACSASKRILVDRTLHDELAERLAAAVARQVVGPATDAATTVGPLVSAAAAERVADQVARAVAEGATLVAGASAADGAYFAPVLLAGTPPSAAVARDEEIFGPTFVLVPVDGVREAVEVANGSSFGLMASVFTADMQLALATAERLDAGGVVINGTDNYRPPIIPFGGTKLSGAGREGLGYTLHELTREKTIVLRRFRAPRPELEGL